MADPAVIIVGGDNLALLVCEQMREFEHQDVTILWARGDDGFAERVNRCGAQLVRGKPNDDAMLRVAGICEAESLLLLTDDDHLNLETALKARDLNAGIRIVMRQFNRALGRKIEQNLVNCSVVSVAAHSAATYAAVAVDRSCYYGVQFPDIDGPLVGFAQRSAARSGVDGMTVAEAEAHLRCRIVAVDGDLTSDRAGRIRGRDRLWTCAPVRSEGRAHQPGGLLRAATGAPLAQVVRRALRALARSDGLIRRVALSAFSVYAVASAYFSATLHVDPLTAAYFVMATMTTTGYGDIVPHSTDHAEQLAAMVTMAAGVVFTTIFVAVLTSYFARAQWTVSQGVRRITRSDHIVVCGAGNVGTRVIDFLRALGREVVVIEAKPKSAIVDRSRDREFDLLTADATSDATLAHCNLAEADALVALTESDTMNLEVALGARAINARLPVVLRVQESTFAQSIAVHFGLDRTFGTAGLAAPLFAGLSRSPGVRGFVMIAGREFGVSELDPQQLLDVPGRVPLFAWRDRELVPIVDFGAARAGERVLSLYPVYNFLRRNRRAPEPLRDRDPVP